MVTPAAPCRRPITHSHRCYAGLFRRLLHEPRVLIFQVINLMILSRCSAGGLGACVKRRAGFPRTPVGLSAGLTRRVGVMTQRLLPLPIAIAGVRCEVDLGGHEKAAPGDQGRLVKHAEIKLSAKLSGSTASRGTWAAATDRWQRMLPRHPRHRGVRSWWDAPNRGRAWRAHGCRLHATRWQPPPRAP